MYLFSVFSYSSYFEKQITDKLSSWKKDPIQIYTISSIVNWQNHFASDMVYQLYFKK